MSKAADLIAEIVNESALDAWMQKQGLDAKTIKGIKGSVHYWDPMDAEDLIYLIRQEYSLRMDAATAKKVMRDLGRDESINEAGPPKDMKAYNKRVRVLAKRANKYDSFTGSGAGYGVPDGFDAWFISDQKDVKDFIAFVQKKFPGSKTRVDKKKKRVLVAYESIDERIQDDAVVDAILSILQRKDRFRAADLTDEAGVNFGRASREIQKLVKLGMLKAYPSPRGAVYGPGHHFKYMKAGASMFQPESVDEKLMTPALTKVLRAIGLSFQQFADLVKNHDIEPGHYAVPTLEAALSIEYGASTARQMYPVKQFVSDAVYAVWQ